ncbi:UNVERIFIED_CONTAM: hypothetical protein Slati_3732700 [Sesamum latifolium]|uniref:Integrase catalytic domain-containing protein n=1 Tax=Sesamum latifolium TaxID=2727402 RepID=A0AAW2U292_9LAMI
MSFLSLGHGHSGTFPLALGQKKFLLVTIDYFTKWVEAELCPYHGRGSHEVHMEKYHMSLRVTPRVNIRQWPTISRSKNTGLVCRIAHKAEIHLVSHPQANGQVEVTNRILVQGIKKRLDRARDNWVEELTSALCSYRTTPRGSTGESPFTLVYGTEAIIPAELGMPSHRILHFNEEHNSQLLREHLDLVDELRETTFIRTQRYKSTIINAHNKRVKARHFQVGDLVLRRVDTLKPVGKLDPKWEGPYKITKIIENDAYDLKDTEGRVLSRPWK